jgi:hypothetical protein
MNCELAKKLKDAGFPQGGDDVSQYFVAQTKTGVLLLVSNRYDKRWQSEDAVKHPTLSELITACGERFKVLERTSQRWWACGCEQTCPEPGSKEWDFEAASAIEAVANLWLALNGTH